jgi:YD repeat-containing protein
MSLFNLEVDFLRHRISAHGIKPDKSKVTQILEWPTPQKSNDVRSFLGLVHYLADHLPALAEHTCILTPLTTKEADRHFPLWNTEHVNAFQAIKDLVISPHCLMTIDHDNPGGNKIFLTCDASDYCTSAVLSWGKTWKTARPVAFDSF